MIKEIQLCDIVQDGLLHSRIEEVIFDNDKKHFILHIDFIRLKIYGSFYNCTITITDWWDFEVYEYDKQKRVRQFDLKEIPEIDRIIKLTYENNELILTDFGIRNNTAIDYKFTKPKIHITGQYDPD